MKESQFKFDNIPKGEKFICLFSSGKDCNLALSIALQTAEAVALLHCVFDNDSHEPATYLNSEKKDKNIEKQAEVLEIPVDYCIGHWTKWNKLIKIYKKYIEQGVKYIVLGDLKSEISVDYQNKLCKSVGLIPFFPLYQKPYDIIMSEFENRNIEAIISVIRSDKIPNNWLGKIFNRETYDNFKLLNIDPMGENGEFHTTVLNSDCFKRRLNYKILGKDSRQIFIELL